MLITVVFTVLAANAVAQTRQPARREGPASAFSQVLGRPTDRSVAVNVLSASDLDAFIEYGIEAGEDTIRTPVHHVEAGEPTDFELADLKPDTPYFYRVHTRASSEGEFEAREQAGFHTQRPPGASFVFAVQGDSHPERLGRMYDPDLYVRTLQNVAADQPEFYFLMGDDFSIEHLFERGPKTQQAVDLVYAHQRGFLGLVGRNSPLMLVNGNHEQAAKYLLDATPENFAVFAGRARTRYFPLPAPSSPEHQSIYTGNDQPVEHIGLRRDYYAWEWGDALFVVIDPYWHSDAAVDNEAGEQRGARNSGAQSGGADSMPEGQPASGRQGKEAGGRGRRDLWQITLGDVQYQWLSQTLKHSDATFKFVFSHHVLGTGRGGIERAGGFEWGGDDNRGVDRFKDMRPDWEQPIHDLMRDAGVSIFFQGHDHLYARQELDGVIYQTCPNPADPTFTAFNRDAFESGDLFPNSGHLRVTVTGGAEASVTVEYVRSLRPGDEDEDAHNGDIVHAYSIGPRRESEQDH